MAKLTEAELSLVFETVLTTKEWGTRFVPFTRIAREVACSQGRPDYVVSPTLLADLSIIDGHKLAEVLTNPTSAKIIATLKPSAPRTEEYILQASGLLPNIVSRRLIYLEEQGFIRRIGRSCYALSDRLPRTEQVLWAFELKLYNWHRALYQALQYQAFAHRVVIVMPNQWAHRIESHITQFKNLNVGIMALNEGTGEIRVINWPKQRLPQSRFHYLYALGKFIQDSLVVSELASTGRNCYL